MTFVAACRGRGSSRAAPDSVLRLRRAPSQSWRDFRPRAALRFPPAPAFANETGARHESWQSLDLDRQDRREVAHDGIPRVAAIGGGINLSAGGAEINAARFERVNGHRVAQHVHVTILLWQTFREWFPFISAGAAAIHAQLAVRRKMFGVALDGDDEDRFRFVRVNVNREAEVGR